MNDLSHLPFSIIAACLATVGALIIGVDRALKRSNWSANRRRRTVFTVAAASVGWFAVSVALASLGGQLHRTVALDMAWATSKNGRRRTRE
jgi:hypothetical protein